MTMKRTVLFSLIFLFSVSILFAKADTTQTGAPGIDMFVGTWSTDGAQADIQFINGFFQVHVETFDHGYDWNEWDYLCTYDEDRQALIASSTGEKHTYVYDFDTDCEAKSTIYQNGSAIFTLHPEGYLLWLDENEDAGQELLFTKMGNYSGIWQCDNISIDFYATGGAYRCIVSKYEGDILVTKWTYSGKYDLASGNVITDNRNNKEILIGCDDEGEIYDTEYDDGAAVFSINSDGYLLWNDLKENVGSGLLFIKEAQSFAINEDIGEISLIFADQDGVQVVQSESAMYLRTADGYSGPYDTIDPFYRDAAIVSIDFQYGLIDRQGIEILPCKHQSIERWGDCYVIQENYLYGLADLNGTILVEPAYHALYYHDGTAAVEIHGENGGAGIISKDGTTLVPLVFHQAAPFDQEWAWVQRMDTYQCNYINEDGIFLLEEDVNFCEGFYGEYLIVSSSSGNYIVNRQGEICSDKTEMEIYPLDYECLFLMEGEEEILIWNAAKQEALPCEYERIKEIGDERYAVYNGEKWGFLDADFQLVVPCVYDYAWSFCQERSWVQADDHFYLIDPNGSVLFSEKLIRACSFSEGVAAIQTESGWGFIDREGNILLSPSLQAEGIDICFIDGVCDLIPYDPYAAVFLDRDFNVISQYDLYDEYSIFQGD